MEHEETDTIGCISQTVDSREEKFRVATEKPKLRSPCSFSKLIALQIPSKDDLLEKLKNEEISDESTTGIFHLDSPLDDGHLIRQDPSTLELQKTMSEEEDAPEEETITEDLILLRINSHKETKSYQLGKHLSCRWSTGAGPRIGCVRDYPSGLQSHALEQVNLSPRSKRRLRFNFLSQASTPNSSNLSRTNSHTLAHSAHLYFIESVNPRCSEAE